VLGFKIQFPDTWSVDEAPKDNVATRGISSSEVHAKGYAVAQVEVFPLKDRMELEEVVYEAVKDIAKVFKNYKILEKVECEIANTRAFRVTFFTNDFESMPLCDGKLKHPVKIVAYFLIGNKRSYLLTTSANKEDYCNYSDEFKSIENSFELN